MDEKVKNIDGIDIIYKIKKRKYDNNHLIVVFSGFGSEGGFFTYDFVNVLSESPATVIWIKDDFSSICAYYLCKDFDFSIERAVYKFISNMLIDLDIKKEQCTLAGFSKGGTAAIYFGIKYNFKNILSTVPQFKIGSYVHTGWPAVAENMMGEVLPEKISMLDSLLPIEIDKDIVLDKNIYLLTSIADHQYEGEVKPNLLPFFKYKNFNLFYAQSLLVAEHSQVSSYHVPLILGILNSICQGAIPHYGYTELKADMRFGGNEIDNDAVAILRKIPIDENVIFPEGISLIKGVACPGFGDINVRMVFLNDSSEIFFTLAKRHQSILSRQFYNGGYVNYDKGWFCSNKLQGIDLTLIPAGIYKIMLEITCGGVQRKTDLLVYDKSALKEIISNDKLKVFSKEGHVYLSKND
ncbi:accessory Sec system protein Asp2 [Kluyvera cryocrescens]|uniref:accessory Sec system protein Asp2 n=1 Tax=Kluyvera TaxID=579 RepID=UPI0039F6B350